MTKTCTKCKTPKPLTEFHKRSSNKDGYHTLCKVCRNIQARSQWNRGSDRINSRRRAQYKLNPTKKRESSNKYSQNNKGKIRERNVKYYRNNRTKSLNSSRERLKARYRSDPVYKYKLKSTAQIRMCLTGKPFTYRCRLCNVVGKDGKALEKYLWATFELKYGIPRGFIARNLVEIDHIIPLCTAITLQDVDRLNHYTNLQLLLKEDNVKKGSKLPNELQGEK